MSKTKYIPITYSQFQSLMTEMGFKEIVVEGAYERIWSFVIMGTSYEIRVFSSVSTVTGVTRRNGQDAIRCTLFHSGKNKPVLSYTVYRTVSAIQNVKAKCRILWKHTRDCKCKRENCDGIMVERESRTFHKFKGCSNFPDCTQTENIVQTQLKIKI